MDVIGNDLVKAALLLGAVEPQLGVLIAGGRGQDAAALLNEHGPSGGCRVYSRPQVHRFK